MATGFSTTLPEAPRDLSFTSNSVDKVLTIMETVECDVCFHRYDEDERHPRNLACGHTLCSVCITDGITDGQLTCPFCREVHKVASPSDIPVSFSFLKVIRALAAGEKDSEQTDDETKSKTKVPIKKSLEPEVHAGICSEHGSYRLFWCLNCQIWICRDCTVVEHPSGTCTVIALKQAMEKLKKEEEELVNEAGTSKDSFVKVLNKYKRELYEKDEKHDEQLVVFPEIIAKQKDMKSLLHKEQEQVEASLNEIQKAFEKMTVQFKNMTEDTTVEGTTTKRHTCQRYRKDLKNLLSVAQEELTKKDALKVSGELHKRLQMALKLAECQTVHECSLVFISSMLDKLLEFQDITTDDLRYFMSHTSIWAIADDKSMGANVTMEDDEDDQIHLHALRKATPPPNAFAIPYSHIRSLTKAPLELFLDLSWGGEKKGRICINLENETGLCAQFLERCTEGNSSSLLGSKMVQVLDNHINTIHRSFHEHSSNRSFHKHSSNRRLCGGGDNSVTSNIVENLLIQQEYVHEPTHNWVTLCKINESVGFCIWLDNHQFQHNSYVTLGRLTKGMDICKLAANYGNIKEVEISECGLLIN